MSANTKEEPAWKYASEPKTLVMHLSNGKQIGLAWVIVTQFEMDSLKGKSDRDPVSITISVGRASYGVAIFKEHAQELFDELARRKIDSIRPIHPIIEIGKITTTQPEEG